MHHALLSRVYINTGREGMIAGYELHDSRYLTVIRAESNGRSTDNVRSNWGFDRSNVWLESSTTNAWNAKNAIFSHTSRVTFGPWITWRSYIAAAPTNPNRACQLGFDFSVHVVALYAISRPCSVLIESGNCSSLTSIAKRQTELFALELTSA